ncbi:MAG: cysteine synthase [Myxococcales bacterium]|nr:cysteine synthase [Myxococcales bacterium]
MTSGRLEHPLANVIGRTPLHRLTRIVERDDVQVLAKLEGSNLGGSVKDRAAWAMIETAESAGLLQPGQKLVEPTSGNTGIALAMLAALKGLDLTLTMPASATAERVAILRAYGAHVVLTPDSERMEGAIDRARALVDSGGYLMLDQFSNPANPGIHEQTTGPEIWEATNGRVTHFVSAMGTTGTIMGVSRALKARNPAVQICGVQPKDDARIPGIRRWPEAYLPRIFERDRVDRIIDCGESEALEMTRRLARVEGLFVGVSAGGAGHVALEVARDAPSGSVVVFIVPDRGDRYLSMPDLFALS